MKHRMRYILFFLILLGGGLFFNTDYVSAEEQYCEYSFVTSLNTNAYFKYVNNNGKIQMAFTEIDKYGKARDLDDIGFGTVIVRTGPWWNYKTRTYYMYNHIVDSAFFDENNNFICPNKIYIDREKNLIGTEPTGGGSINIYLEDGGDYEAIMRKGYVDSSGAVDRPANDKPVGPVIEYEDTCSIFDGKMSKIVKNILLIIKIGIPILIIILGIIDFINAMVASDDKALNEAKTRFVKRLIAGVLIIFLPSLLSVLINISGVLEQYGISDVFCSL